MSSHAKDEGSAAHRGADRAVTYRLRRSLRTRVAGYLAIVTLVGLVGGVALGSIAAARRTQSSFSTFIGSTNPSAFAVGTAIFIPGSGSPSGYNAVLTQKILHLPHVGSVDTQSGVNALPLHPNGDPIDNAYIPPSAGNALGSDGYGFSKDRFAVVDGRLPDPRNPDEIAMLPSAAQAFHVRVGQRFPMGIYTNEQTLMHGFGTRAVSPYRKIDPVVVGLIVPNVSIVVDDVDAGNTELAYFTPAFTRQVLACCSNYAFTGIQLKGGTGLTATVESEVAKVLPPGNPHIFSGTLAEAEGKAARALRPQGIALAAFGAIAGLAALIIAGQLIGRSIRGVAGDAAVLRMFGASPTTIVADEIAGVLVAVVIGSLLSAAVAIVLSPLAPLGPLRRFDPTSGVSFDWTVLGIGVGTLIVVLGLMAIWVGWWQAPHRVARRRRGWGAPTSAVARGAANAGLPVPAVMGMRFALESEVRGEVVPVRSAILGAALALMVVVGTVTFSSSLNTLVSTPRLYGWNWDAALSSGGNIPQAEATRLLDADRAVKAWSGYSYGLLRLDGVPTAVLGSRPGARVAPPLLSGHGLQRSDQVVLGAATLSQLHKRVGDSVTESDGTDTPVRLHIVGTATLPTIGASGLAHLEMGSGALLATDLIPASQRNLFGNPLQGPNVILVDFKPAVDRSRADALGPIAAKLSNTANFGVAVQTTPVHPAEIVNYRSMGTTPAVLGSALAVGAVAALALTLMTSVRRRRHDLALLKCIGLTGTQLRSTLAWQSSISVAIGAVVGVPVGIAVGRQLWDLFATQIHAVPAPTVPLFEVIVIAVGALVLANLVSAVPGHMAAKTPSAFLLRAE